MNEKSINGLTLYYADGEEAAAEIIGSAAAESEGLLNELWRLVVPEDCRVYVMTSWREFLSESAPWYWKIPMVLTFPLWAARVSRLWRFAGGWAQRYGNRQAVGVKPPRLLESADTSLGERIFVKLEDVDEKVRRITCHELVHAFSSHLRLPSWLNEGLAMVTVDYLAGEPTVKVETLETLRSRAGRDRPKGYRQLSVKDPDSMIYHYVRGYWITRYVLEADPESLVSLLKERMRSKELEQKLAASMEMSREQFWSEIDGIVANYFEKKYSPDE
ncbi:MAG: hypothetical protein GTO18_16105 [Anaerolineales bacterium]|nr:hypothetical protein [Anaerolineales bacterium]